MLNDTFIIAEIGVNHNGSIELAKSLIDKGVEAGVDAVKFQTFIAEELISKSAKKAEYQINNTNNSNETQLEMIKKLELSFDDFMELKDYCDSKNIHFMSTAFDFKSIDFLSQLDMLYWKIPSGEITNYPYVKKIGSLGKRVILSTGMADLDEVEFAINTLKEAGTEDITVLQCTTEYPAPFDEVNLRAMISMGEKFNIDYGFSDHTPGITVPIAAVALGAKVIEKHYTLDKNMEGPDHKASLDPVELKSMVESIRIVELSLGDGVKKPTNSEIKNKDVARKSIVASKDIKKGEIFTEDNITTKRPGGGISPREWDNIIGTEATREFNEDELIEL